MPKTEPTKSLKELLNDPELESKPNFEASSLAPEKMSLKNLFMMQAFQVFITSIIERHGNTSIMSRKWSLAQSEVTNALQLALLVGESFDALTQKLD